jgi:hypothetical protein
MSRLTWRTWALVLLAAAVLLALLLWERVPVVS